MSTIQHKRREIIVQTWTRARYELLITLSTERTSWNTTRIAKQHHCRAGTMLRRYLSDLETLRLVQRNAQAVPVRYMATDAGYSVAAASYVSLSDMQLLWALEALGKTACALQIHQAHPAVADTLTILRSKMSRARKTGLIRASGTPQYYQAAYRTAYQLTAKGQSTLQAYRSLKALV